MSESLILSYITDFLEKANPAFSNMPICPFAKRERLDKRIFFQAGVIDDTPPTPQLLEHIRHFHDQPDLGTFLYYDPNHTCSLERAYTFAQELIDALKDIGLLAVPIHPEDPFAVAGVRTRGASPFVMMAIQSHQILYEAKEKLKKTAYYAHWEDAQERNIMQVIEYVEAAQTSGVLVAYWWKPNILAGIQRQEIDPQPIIGSTVDILDCNGIHLWMQRFGQQFGWKPLCPWRADKMDMITQACQDLGFVILTGHGGNEAGLLVYIVWDPESQSLQMYPQHCDTQRKLIASYCWVAHTPKS